MAQSRAKRSRAGAWASVLALSLVVGTGPAWPPSVGVSVARADGDATIARALLESGIGKLKDREYTAAVTLLDQALDESEEVFEAAYHKGVALERLERSREALSAYRWFVRTCTEHEEDGEVERDVLQLKKRAERKIDQLAAGELELDKLGRELVDDLLAFARKHDRKDPAIAARALRHVLAVEPGNEDAAELLEKLGFEADADDEPAAESDAGGGSGPFSKLPVEEWIDFIGLRSFPTGGTEYGDGTVTRDSESGKIVHFSAAKSNVERYVLELEWRIHEVHERGWASGWVVGEDDARFIGIFAQNSSVDFVFTNKKTGARADLGGQPMAPLDMDAWHRLDVLVDGAKVEVHLDGERMIEEELATHAPLTGQIGVFHQRSRVEFRVARMGVLK